MDLGKSIRHALIALITTTALAGASATIFSTPPQIVQASETATISPTKARVTNYIKHFYHRYPDKNTSFGKTVNGTYMKGVLYLDRMQGLTGGNYSGVYSGYIYA